MEKKEELKQRIAPYIADETLLKLVQSMIDLAWHYGEMTGVEETYQKLGNILQR